MSQQTDKQPPSLKRALRPEGPALDPALTAHVGDLTSHKTLGECNEAYCNWLSHQVRVAVRQGCVESTPHSCRRSPPSHTSKKHLRNPKAIKPLSSAGSKDGSKALDLEIVSQWNEGLSLLEGVTCKCSGNCFKQSILKRM